MTNRNRKVGGRAGKSEAYDLAIIGAGSAGFSAAITAADLGARVALIGHGVIGGTCVNIGCVPSKTLIRAVETIHQATSASRFVGIEGHAGITDWRAVIAQKNELVAELRQTKYADLLPAYDGITHIDGPARLVDGGVAIDGQTIRAAKVMITTGARPAVPDIAGINDVPYLTSTTALELDRLPASLLVIGGGYIGSELGQMLARAGVKVTIACRSRLLPKAEPEISEALTGHFKDEGISIQAGMSYLELIPIDHGVALRITRDGPEERLEAEQVLVTTGRQANIEGLQLAEAGVATDARGRIVVDEWMRTTKIGIYAAGDVTDRDQFVYMAAYGARLGAENALNGDSRSYDATAMPSVVFTDPQLASVGLTELEAGERGLQVRSSVLPLRHVPRALAARDTRGLIKLVAEAETGRLVGAHILAPEGADSIQTAALAIKYGLTVRDLAEMIFPYLTTVEGLKLAAQTFEKDVALLSCCAG